jgi:membrane protease subunit (stomatin/prohibitin family)
MSETWWAVLNLQGEILAIKKTYIGAIHSAVGHNADGGCVEVEVRPVNEEQCEWEKYCKLGGNLRTPDLANGNWKYCPECGRKL